MSEVIILRQFDKMGYAEFQFCLRGLLVDTNAMAASFDLEDAVCYSKFRGS